MVRFLPVGLLETIPAVEARGRVQLSSPLGIRVSLLYQSENHCSLLHSYNHRYECLGDAKYEEVLAAI